jgi:hypothetical protein
MYEDKEKRGIREIREIVEGQQEEGYKDIVQSS